MDFCGPLPPSLIYSLSTYLERLYISPLNQCRCCLAKHSLVQAWGNREPQLPSQQTHLFPLIPDNIRHGKRGQGRTCHQQLFCLYINCLLVSCGAGGMCGECIPFSSLHTAPTPSPRQACQPGVGVVGWWSSGKVAVSACSLAPCSLAAHQLTAPSPCIIN